MIRLPTFKFQQSCPTSDHPMTYKERLNAWTVVCLLPDMQQNIVGRFRSRSDAEGHMKFLRHRTPTSSFMVVFDCQSQHEEQVTGTPVVG